MIGIIDYGMGNLKSVINAFQFLGFQAKIIHSYSEMPSYDKIVLPGVGAFGQAVDTLRKCELDKGIMDFIATGKPFLGICLGMQLIFDSSCENGCHQGLGILSGEIVRLPETVKAPHIGWNSLNTTKLSPLLDGIGHEPYVYFVHSYYLQTNADIVCATTFYGRELQVAVCADNIHAFQFHPEKSGDTGLRMIRNFAAL